MSGLRYIVLLIASMVMTVGAGEYVIQPGDDLTKISKFTGHNIEQLMQMNDIENVDHIFVGQRIVYISEQDIENAYLYCQKKIVELKSSDLWSVYFKQALKDLDKRNIRYSGKAPNRDTAGISYWMVLSLAYTWEQNYANNQ